MQKLYVLPNLQMQIPRPYRWNHFSSVILIGAKGQIISHLTINPVFLSPHFTKTVSILWRSSISFLNKYLVHICPCNHSWQSHKFPPYCQIVIISPHLVNSSAALIILITCSSLKLLCSFDFQNTIFSFPLISSLPPFLSFGSSWFTKPSNLGASQNSIFRSLLSTYSHFLRDLICPIDLNSVKLTGSEGAQMPGKTLFWMCLRGSF